MVAAAPWSRCDRSVAWSRPGANGWGAHSVVPASKATTGPPVGCSCAPAVAIALPLASGCLPVTGVDQHPHVVGAGHRGILRAEARPGLRIAGLEQTGDDGPVELAVTHHPVVLLEVGLLVG